MFLGNMEHKHKTGCSLGALLANGSIVCFVWFAFAECVERKLE